MSTVSKTSSTLIAAMLISVFAIGQSMDYSQKRQAQLMPEKLTQDVLPGIVPVNFAHSDFDYTKLVTSDGSKDVIWDNGPLLTNVGGGFNGADLSALQASLGMGSYGGGFQIPVGITIADDFEITEYTTVTTITFFAYQTGGGIPSTINKVYFQIWDGDPSAGGSVIFGDLATNRLISTDWTYMYRASDEYPENSDRAIMNVVADASGLYLPAGTYWVEVQAGGSASSGPWCPPVTILGETTTGNALQNSGGWDTWLDSGTSTQQGMPFIINGTSGPQATNDVGVTQIISPISGNELGMETVIVNIKNFGTEDQSDFDLSFSVNGGSAFVETISATVPSNGNLEYTFIATADLSSFGNYTIEACTMLAGDENASNDCSTEIVSNMLIQSVTVYPMMEDYWTGSTDGATKTQTSLVKGLGDIEEGWMKFDVTAIPAGLAITEVIFHGYVYETNFPYWSITPLASDPVTTNAATLYTEILAGAPENIAYSYNDEDETFAPGWHEYVLGTTVIDDLTAATAQGWFAVGCASRDLNDTYFVLLEGWNETNMPFLEVYYNEVVLPSPTDLTAEVIDEDIVLNWVAPGSNSDDGKDFIAYKVYYSFEGGSFGLLAEDITETTFTHVDEATAGLHSYYVTALYDEGESLPSNEAELLITSIKDQLTSSTIVYPNPASDRLTIKSATSLETIKIYNQVGQLVKQIATDSKILNLNVSEFESGIYLIKVFSHENVFTQKLVIE